MGNGPLKKYHQTQVHLSKGPYAEVYKAQEKGTTKNWAMKIYDKKGEYHADYVAQEVQTMRLCNDPNIVKLQANFETGSKTYIIFTYCKDGELADRIRLKERVSEFDMAAWLKQILRALDYLLKKSICHRDVKPSNFLFHKDVLKLTEFGVACIVSKGKPLRDGVGTGAFKAPELYFDKYRKEPGPGYSFPVDMWAAGLTLHVMMTGVINGPFFDETTSSIQEKKLEKGEISSFRRQTEGVMQIVADGLDDMPEAMKGAISTFTTKSFSSIGSAKKLCQAMVNPDQNKRLTPEQALAHEWFQDLGDKSVAPSAGGATAASLETAVTSGDDDDSPPASKTKCCIIS